MTLPAHRARPFDRAHGPEYVERASRARNGEQDASKGNFVLIVSLVVGSNRLDPAYKAGLAGHVPVTSLGRQSGAMDLTEGNRQNYI